MDMILKRFYDNHYSTTGIIYINGTFFCATLEPPFRHKKVLGSTRIPAGEYGIEMNYTSPMAMNYQNKFDIDCLPRLIDVPGFEGILIHIGNYKRDTEGCILVGNTIQINIENGMDRQKILNSKSTLVQLNKAIEEKQIDRIIILDD